MADWEPSENFDQWYGCRNCGYFRGNCCVAYPHGIPFLIASGQVDHFVPRPGQIDDTVFTPLDLDVFKRTGERAPAPASKATKAR